MEWKATYASLLQGLVSSRRLGVLSDLDGTLSMIAPVPEMAHVTERNRQALVTLQAQIALVAVVSGRGVSDLRARVGLPELVYVGNHGLERWTDEEVIVEPEARLARPNLEQALAQVQAHVVDGIWIEDKFATASIHYRQAANPEAVRAQLKPLIEQIAQENGLKFFEGRKIFELRPPVEVDKGTSFRRLIEEYALDGAVFLGDDTTDADAMRVARELRASGQCYSIGVGVESEATPDSILESADILVAGVSGVEDFLGWLVNSLSASVI
jgi:trehalose 6-phosphate phosphatase